MDEQRESLPSACRKVLDAAENLSLPINIRILEQSSRTAEEAALACDTTLGQIVKSLVFCRKDNGEPVMLLVSGKNRVHEGRVGKMIGSKLKRPDAQFVREATGYAIGGIPPFGHSSDISVWIDEDLLIHDQVFAAAGTPNSIFPIDPQSLTKALSATVISVV